MSNLTISLDDELIKQARVKAIQQGTSLSAKIREFVADFARQDIAADEQKRRSEAAARLMAAIDAAAAEARPDPVDQSLPRRTLRDELYDGDFRQRLRGEA